MPILLFGSSGVGKSLLAEYIYQYAKFIGTIPEDAPFVVLNCADYANNKELLSSVLFGYKKGAFTGANKDTKGICFWMKFIAYRQKDRKSYFDIWIKGSFPEWETVDKIVN